MVDPDDKDAAPERRAADSKPRLSPPYLLLGLATIAALVVVPDWPHRHLDDPSYWGLIGYLVVFAAVLTRGSRSWSRRSSNRRLIRLFLVGLPAIYVANGVRYGGSTGELALQLAGLVIWLGLALAAGRSDLALWAGCVAHAFWDGAHFGRADFIPGWYASACLAVDIGLGAFVLLCLHDSGLGPRAHPIGSSTQRGTS